jgi:hypothetical protein
VNPLRWFSSFDIVATALLIATVGRMLASVVECSGMYLLSTNKSTKLEMKKKSVLTTEAKVTLCLKNEEINKMYPKSDKP